MNKLMLFFYYINNYGNSSIVFKTKRHNIDLVMDFEILKNGVLSGKSYLVNSENVPIFLGDMSNDTIDCAIARMLLGLIKFDDSEYTVNCNCLKKRVGSCQDLFNRIYSMTNLSDEEIDSLPKMDASDIVEFLSKKGQNKTELEHENISELIDRLFNFKSRVDKKKKPEDFNILVKSVIKN